MFIDHWRHCRHGIFLRKSYLILAGVILIIWGFSNLRSEGPGPGGGSGGGSSGNNPDPGYDGPIHTGTGRPTSVTKRDGTKIDTSGPEWRNCGTGGKENIVTGERAENGILGNPQYTDSDGDVDNDVTFGYD